MKIDNSASTKKQLVIQKIQNIPLIQQARLLAHEGVVIQQLDYHFLKIDDAFIHRLNPLLNQPTTKPDYFTSPTDVGAHITILYPEEETVLKKTDLHIRHSFIVEDLCKATLDGKTYYVLLVEAPSLVALRERYGLLAQPQYKNCRIQFHITIGVGA